MNFVWRFMICRDTPTHGWVHGWLDGWVVQWVNGWGQVITKYWINLDVIEIIQFCLKIYDLWRHPYPWVDGWVNGWAHVKSLKSNKSWPNQDNSIMDIFDIFWTFYLNHLSPLWGYFLFFTDWNMILKIVYSGIVIIKMYVSVHNLFLL